MNDYQVSTVHELARKFSRYLERHPLIAGKTVQEYVAEIYTSLNFDEQLTEMRLRAITGIFGNCLEIKDLN